MVLERPISRIFLILCVVLVGSQIYFALRKRPDPLGAPSAAE